MNSRTTLQTILKRRQQEMFVGREEKEVLFNKNLTLDTEDERRRFIFNIFGQGGVGKSTLMHRFRQLASEANAITAWCNELQEDVPAVLGQIAEQLEKQGYILKRFRESFQIYRRLCQELLADPDAPQGLSVFIGDLAKTNSQINRWTRVNEILEFMEGNTIATDESILVTYLTRKLTNLVEIHLVQSPCEVLTPLFVEELRKIEEEKCIVIFFDTYEDTRIHLDDWLRNLLEGSYGDLPVNIILVIAGRDELDMNLWEIYERLLIRFPLEPFTHKEAYEFLDRKGITDKRIREIILRLSKRLPLLMATLAAESPDDPEQIGDPSGTAIERFLKWEKDQKRRQLALNAALPRYLNQDVLTELIGEKDSDVLFAWLKQKPFVEEHISGWIYHSVVRAQMLHYKRRESPEEWYTLHNLLVDYYTKSRAILGFNQEQGQRNAIWQHFTLEILYHGICQAPHKYISSALNGFISAFNIPGTFARHWAETVKQAGEDAEDIDVQRLGEILVQGVKAYDEDCYEAAACMFTAILGNSNIEARWLPVALGWRGYFYLQTYNYSQALTDLSKAIDLAPEESMYWVKRGWTYYRMGHFKETLDDFSKAIELKPDVAGIIFFRGLVYQKLECYEAAAADFTRVIELMPNVVGAIKIRGQVNWELKHYDEALEDFDRVIELMPDVAGAIAMRGQVYCELERYNEALADFNRAIQLKPNDPWVVGLRSQVYCELRCYDKALEDFDRAIALTDSVINSWSNERGLVLSYLGRYPEAIESYEKGLSEGTDRYGFLYNIAVAIARWKGFIVAKPYIEKAYAALIAAAETDARGSAIYGLGGLEALAGNNDKALDYLEQAVTFEVQARQWARHDRAWLNLQNDARFQQIVYH